MPLEFEENVVSKSMRSIPTMSNGNFLVRSIFKFFSSQSIMLNIIDNFKEENGKNCLNNKENSCLSSINKIHYCCECYRPDDAKNCVVCEE